MENHTNVIRNYKDTVFRMIFKDRRELLELFNAVSGSSYTDPEALEIMTLENAIYMSMKNDISCLLDMRLHLYEQQSSVNPNIPLRDLMYVARQYEKLIIDKDVYSSRLIKLPTPKFIVFYNGLLNQPARREFRLSEAFEFPVDEPSLELIVTQFNINEGYNDELLAKSPTLWQYMTYVNKIRFYRKTMSLELAVQNAIDACIKENVLREFLLKNKAEVINMSIFEYDEELHKKTLRAEGYEDGFADGFEDGAVSRLISQICRKLRKGKSSELIAEELEEDFGVVDNICTVAQNFAPNYDEKAIAEQFQHPREEWE